ncbi:MAG: OB-fold domain-containing protein [Candidatus Helarchaeota archaeon]
MVGIKSWGTYLPGYKLPRKAIAQAWDFPVVPGTKSVANYDEDSITMAVEAGLECLKGIDLKTIDGLFFASTTAPYAEKVNASFITQVLDLKNDILTNDFLGTTRAATTALRVAYDTIKAGDAKNILIVSADKRDPEPLTMYEYAFGDAGSAVLVSDDSGIASIEGYYSIGDNAVGPYRRSFDEFVRTFEIKVETKLNYTNAMIKVFSGIMEKFELTPEKINRAAYYAPDPRFHNVIAKKMKFDKKAVVDTLWMDISNVGTPLTFLALATVFEKVKEGYNILVGGYGDGADAFYLISTGKSKELAKDRMRVKKRIRKQKTMDNYNSYLKSRYLVKSKKPRTRKASPVQIWREVDRLHKLYGIKCKKCGAIQYPNWRACMVCGEKDDYELYKLPRHGKLYTFTLDHLIDAEYFETPVPRCVIDVDGGGRILLDMTDCNPYDVKIGDEVDIVFRKMHEGGDLEQHQNMIGYYYKCKPASVKKDVEE